MPLEIYSVADVRKELKQKESQIPDMPPGDRKAERKRIIERIKELAMEVDVPDKHLSFERLMTKFRVIQALLDKFEQT